MNSLTDPPHGYDYGMKSGHCLIKNDEQIKSIESEFDAKGRIQGFVKIDYFNNTRILGHCVDGVMHGITRLAILLIFKFHFLLILFLQKSYVKKYLKTFHVLFFILRILPQIFRTSFHEYAIFNVLN